MGEKSDIIERIALSSLIELVLDEASVPTAAAHQSLRGTHANPVLDGVADHSGSLESVVPDPPGVGDILTGSTESSLVVIASSIPQFRSSLRRLLGAHDMCLLAPSAPAMNGMHDSVANA